jgi:phosphonate transport system permease protein
MDPINKIASQIKPVSQKNWKRLKYPNSYVSYCLWLSILVFIAFSVEYLNIPLNRLLGMMGRMGDIIANRYYPPDIQYIMDIDYAKSIFETIQMAYLGALFGLIAT